MTQSEQFLSPVTSPSTGLGVPTVGALVNQPLELPTLPNLPNKQVVVGSPKTGTQAYDTMNTGKNMILSGLSGQAASTAAANTLSAQDYAARAGVDVSRVVSNPQGGYMIGPDTKGSQADTKQIANEMLQQLGETPAPTVSPEQTTLDTLTTNLQTIQTDLETRWAEKQKEIDAINNGTHPLTTAEQAQIDDISRSYEKMKQDQIEINKRYEGGVRASNVSRGLSELAQYDAEGRMFTAMSEGADKVREIDREMTKAVNNLTAAFRKDDLAAIKTSYDEYNKLLESRATSIKDIYSATTAFQKTLADQKKQALKDEYDQIIKPIQDIGLDAAKNNAPPEIRAAIKASKTVDDAISAAGTYLREATGDAGDYLNYIRDAEANGVKPLDYLGFIAAKKRAESAPKTLTEGEKNKNDVMSMATELQSIVAKDGFVDPIDYQTALNAWVGLGHTAASFHTTFSNYRNPYDSKYNIGKEGEKTTTKFLSKDYYKSIYTDAQLKQGAKAAGLKNAEAYLDYLMKGVEAKRKAGLTDTEIAKQ